MQPPAYSLAATDVAYVSPVGPTETDTDIPGLVTRYWNIFEFNGTHK